VTVIRPDIVTSLLNALKVESKRKKLGAMRCWSEMNKMACVTRLAIERGL